MAGRAHPRNRRAVAADGRHPDRLRAVDDHRAAVEPVRAGPGDGYESAHSRWYWGVKLLLLTTADGTVTGFGLASPKLFGERAETREVLGGQPANRPRPGSIVVTDKGLSGADSEQFFTDCDLVQVRPARRDEKTPRPFPNWLRQRIEAIIWTLNALCFALRFRSLRVSRIVQIDRV